ncbi:MAG: hypothetical protein ACM3RP_06665 [Chitinophagales bacterium]
MKKLALLLAVLVVLLVGVSLTVAAADQYPNGCADCHKGDKSLSATVKTLPKHPPVAATADVNACLKCHKAGGPMALNKKMHDSHQKQKIACDACHVTVGKPDIKGVKK